MVHVAHDDTLCQQINDDGCFRQYELAGVLAHAAHPDAAQQLVEFLVSEPFQADMPLQMFVWPVRDGTPLPLVFTKYAKVPTQPWVIQPAQIAAGRDRWVSEWHDTVLG